MKNKKLIALLLVAALSVGVGAASTSQQVQATLDANLTVTYNGQVQTLKDANGVTILPMTYNGSTYLPVRAVSDMLGVAVDYDVATRTVILGTTEKQPTALTSMTSTGGTDFSWIIVDKAELSVAGSDATQDYTTGVQWEIWNSRMSTNSNRVVYFDVTGYSEVSFSAWCDIDADIRMYDQDFNVITAFDGVAGSIVSKTFSIPAGTTQIAFGADAVEYEDGTLKILDPTVK